MSSGGLIVCGVMGVGIQKEKALEYLLRSMFLSEATFSIKSIAFYKLSSDRCASFGLANIL